MEAGNSGFVGLISVKPNISNAAERIECRRRFILQFPILPTTGYLLEKEVRTIPSTSLANKSIHGIPFAV